MSYGCFESVIQPALIHPLKRGYQHDFCGTVSTLPSICAKGFASNPRHHKQLYCDWCEKSFPVNDFIWQRTGELVGS